MKLRTEDNVLVMKGRDRGKQGRVTQIFPKQGKVMVEGVNIVTKHQKATGNVRQAGRIQKELPLYAANVMLMCTHCARPTRAVFRVLADGTKARVCTREGCKEVIE